jgi:large subunit ribosomal protein L23
MVRTILLKPVITEKMTVLHEKRNQYAFEVDVNSTKIDIAHAVEKKFNVKVESVRTTTTQGKKKAQFTKRGRFAGFKAKKKRAIITLSKESKIDLFEVA